MIKIQDILDFIGSKRPQYKMENWKNFKKAVKIPIKDENGNVGYYNDDNEKEGIWEGYDENGHLESKGNFVNGKKEGEWLKYIGYNLFRSNFYKNDEIVVNKNGFKIFYDENFIKYYQIEEILYTPETDNSGNELGYFNNNNKLEGKWKLYTNLIKLSEKGSFKNGKKDGYWEFYHDNGELKSKGNYINNKRDGYWEEYWFDNQLRSKGNYVNNERDGYWEKYWGNDKLESKGNFVNNSREGYWEEYWVNGEIQFKGNYDNGFKDGYWEYYWNNGEIIAKGNYVNDEKEGKWDYFDEEGNYTHSETY